MFAEFGLAENYLKLSSGQIALVQRFSADLNNLPFRHRYSTLFRLHVDGYRSGYDVKIMPGNIYKEILISGKEYLTETSETVFSSVLISPRQASTAIYTSGVQIVAEGLPTRHLHRVNSFRINSPDFFDVLSLAQISFNGQVVTDYLNLHHIINHTLEFLARATGASYL